MNRLAGIVAGTALAGGEDKWYEDSAGLLSYNVLKTGKSGQREETTHLYRAEVDQCLPPEVIKVMRRLHDDVLSGAITDICPQYINLVYPTGKVS